MARAYGQILEECSWSKQELMDGGATDYDYMLSSYLIEGKKLLHHAAVELAQDFERYWEPRLLDVRPFIDVQIQTCPMHGLTITLAVYTQSKTEDVPAKRVWKNQLRVEVEDSNNGDDIIVALKQWLQFARSIGALFETYTTDASS